MKIITIDPEKLLSLWASLSTLRADFAMELKEVAHRMQGLETKVERLDDWILGLAEVLRGLGVDPTQSPPPLTAEPAKRPVTLTNRIRALVHVTEKETSFDKDDIIRWLQLKFPRLEFNERSVSSILDKMQDRHELEIHTKGTPGLTPTRYKRGPMQATSSDELIAIFEGGRDD